MKDVYCKNQMVLLHGFDSPKDHKSHSFENRTTRVIRCASRNR